MLVEGGSSRGFNVAGLLGFEYGQFVQFSVWPVNISHSIYSLLRFLRHGLIQCNHHPIYPCIPAKVESSTRYTSTTITESEVNSTTSHLTFRAHNIQKASTPLATLKFSIWSAKTATRVQPHPLSLQEAPALIIVQRPSPQSLPVQLATPQASFTPMRMTTSAAPLLKPTTKRNSGQECPNTIATPSNDCLTVLLWRRTVPASLSRT